MRSTPPARRGIRALIAAAAGLLLAASVFVVASPAAAWSEEETLLTLINTARAERGLPDVSRDAWYDGVAGSWNVDMRFSGFRHSDPAGLADRLGRPGKAGETISQGSKAAQPVFATWMQNPADRAVLLDPAFTTIGLRLDDRPGNYLWTAVWGAVQGTPAIVQPQPVSVSGSSAFTGHLSASTAPWGPVPVALGYQWQVNGNDVPGATGPDFYPDFAQAGAEIRVRVTGTATVAGYRSSSRLSGPATVERNVYPTRIDAPDRYGMAAALSRRGFAEGATTVFIASGANFPDALSAAPVAAKTGGPLLLVTAGTIPEPIVAELDRLRPGRIVIVGGERSISPEVEAALRTRAGEVQRITGADRYEVSRALAIWGFGDGSARSAFLASGGAFADVLSAGAAGRGQVPVILVDGSKPALDAGTEQTLDQLGVTAIEIAGGPASVSTGIEAASSAERETVRLAGANRYTTSIAVNRAHASGSPSPYLATGEKFPDALTGSVVAARAGQPLYVVPPDCVPRDVRESLPREGGGEVVILGGLNSLGQEAGELAACAW